MNLERRKFLKDAYKIGGLTALYTLGAVEEARAWGVLPAVAGSNIITWKNWRELSEERLASKDTFVCFFENTSAGGNEAGQGLDLSGANLILTQSGNVAGATGSPPKRVLDGDDDHFDGTQPLAAAGLGTGGGNWTVVLKVEDCAGLANGEGIIYIDGTNDSVIAFVSTAALAILVKDGGSTLLNATTANNIPTSGVLYIMIWYDGNYIRGGMKATTKPTKWSDFAADDKVTATSACSFGDDFDSSRSLFYDAGTTEFETDAHYFILSKTSFIDNNA